ncbi:hypothetical protein HF086_008359 [Spodoptera exigua]|uniref:Endonuclease/exonuclease/phosphatase domain-containing protein n=1 Tax=Spodoptera exigua TaxID=7107 RepID=A0A922M2U8_SPOEX|nr:hypothetical protein HF086_008359 [Spodoptera exigua]
MEPKNYTCAGCRNVINNLEFLDCCECKLRFDIFCVNIPSNNFYLMDQAYKSAWICPECCCKQLKTDNTNTPVRLANNSGNLRRSPGRKLTSSPKTIHKTQSNQNTPPDLMNVTLRKNSRQPISTSYSHERCFNEDTLRDIIKEELAAAVKSSFKDLLTDQLKNIQGEISAFKVSFGFFNEQFEEFKKRFEEKDAIINQLRSDNTKLQQNVIDLTTRLCIVEQNMRESNVEINGLPEDKSENLVETLKNIAKVTNCDIGDSDIMQITRVAKQNKENNRPRSVVAKLRSPRQRDNLLAAVGNFNKKHPSDKLNSHHLGIGLGGSRVPVDRLSTKASKKDGGGVMVAVNNKIKSVRIKSWESDFEDLWLSVELIVNNNIKKIAICVIYMPPPVKLNDLQCFLNNVNNILNNVDDVVILGDFNLGFIDWNMNNDDLHLSPSNYENSLGYTLVDFLSINLLHQFNSIINAESRILDLVLSNISDITVTKPNDLLSKLDSHHPNILISIPLSNLKQLKTKYRSGYNFF